MLELQNISYFAPQGDEKEILKGINLKIDDKFTVITGPNGSGKSTLAKIIMGIIQPTDGKILFDGQDITNMSVTDRAKAGISFAFQQPVRFKGITVRDLIQLAAGRKITFDECCDYLSQVGLCARDYVTRELDASLSGGEAKRIEIAMVLARGTKVAIFDEPEAGIDLWSFASLTKVFENLQQQLGGHIIIISHQERILDIADRIILLRDGEIRQEGSKEQIMPYILGTTVSDCRRVKEG